MQIRERKLGKKRIRRIEKHSKKAKIAKSAKNLPIGNNDKNGRNAKKA